MRRRRVARRPVVERAGLFFRQRDQLRERRGRHRRVDHHQQRPARHQAHRRERLARVIAEFAIQARRHRQRAGATVEQRVAIGHGLRHRLRPDSSAGAGAILDNELLTEGIAQFGGDHAPDHIGGPARRERHHDSHRSGWVGLGRRVQGGAGPRAGDQQFQEWFTHSEPPAGRDFRITGMRRRSPSVEQLRAKLATSQPPPEPSCPASPSPHPRG